MKVEKSVFANKNSYLPQFTPSMAICPGLHIRLGEDISQNSSLSSSRSLQYEYSSHHPSTQYGLSAGQAHPGTHCSVQIGSWSSQVLGHALAHLFHTRPPSHSERQRSGWQLEAAIFRFFKWPVVTIFLALFFHAIIFFQIYLGKRTNNCKLSKPKSESRCVKTWLKTARELFEKKATGILNGKFESIDENFALPFGDT